MALHTFCRRVAVDAAQFAPADRSLLLVTFFAGHVPVRDVERKLRFVMTKSFFDPLRGHMTCGTIFPAAVSEELPAVNVLGGMAVRALGRFHGEFRRLRQRLSAMTLRASYLLMRTVQLELRSGVIEPLDRFPPIGCMASFAGQRALVRIDMAGDAGLRREVILAHRTGGSTARFGSRHRGGYDRHGLMTLGTIHLRVSPSQCKFRLRMPRHRKGCR